MSSARTSKARALRARISEVGRDLAGTFGEVLEAIPGAPHRPQRLARRLGVNAVLTSRLLKATKQRDPIVVAHVIPGPEPLHRLLKAAEKLNVSRKLIQEAASAVERFEQLIEVEAGDRSSLDAMISGWLPDAREKVEMIAKQSMFRGASHLLGTSCELSFATVMLVPSAGSTNRADQVWVLQMRGLRRVRPNSVVNYDTVHTGARLQTIDGEPVDSLRGLLLEQFCSTPLPQLEVTHHGDVTQYTLAGEDVGLKSAVDLVHATYLPEKTEIRLKPGEAPRQAFLAFGIDPPSKLLVFDVLLHEDVFPRQAPTFGIYRTAGVVSTRPSNRREIDRLDVLESVQELGVGLERFGSADCPAYQEMLSFVCGKRGWDAESLRGFRCRIEYPIYSAEIVLGFDVPPPR